MLLGIWSGRGEWRVPGGSELALASRRICIGLGLVLSALGCFWLLLAALVCSCLLLSTPSANVTVVGVQHDKPTTILPASPFLADRPVLQHPLLPTFPLCRSVALYLSKLHRLLHFCHFCPPRVALQALLALSLCHPPAPVSTTIPSTGEMPVDSRIASSRLPHFRRHRQHNPTLSRANHSTTLPGCDRRATLRTQVD